MESLLHLVTVSNALLRIGHFVLKQVSLIVFTEVNAT